MVKAKKKLTEDSCSAGFFLSRPSDRQGPTSSVRGVPYRSSGVLPVPRSSDLSDFERGGSMGSLQGPTFCPIVAKQTGEYTVLMNGPQWKSRMLRSELWGCRAFFKQKTEVEGFGQLFARRYKAPQCSYSSSSNGNGSMAENFNEHDEDYVNSTIVEAVEVKSGADGFMVKMRDGRQLKCFPNNPEGGKLPDYAPHPAIVLKMEDGTGLLLPIIVCKCILFISDESDFLLLVFPMQNMCLP
ncbi:hypothetical protein SAY87_021593 [Trapa incisa]|uniref:Uncharacterized protein n=1 Tax=Trapa incisa TaxID=236973 RepID=A0AAN7PWE2_9MYRT|nr:hypothetical protein SAY87_021593 [Trapa incisa]